MNSRVDLPSLALPKGLRDAAGVFARAFCEGLKPDPERKVWQWADAKRKLPQSTSAEPGPWRTDRVPFAREIMEELSPSSPASEVIFMAGTQVSKTETGNNFIGAMIDERPGPGMMVLPTLDTAKRSSRMRLTPMFESTPSLKEKVGDARSRDGANTALLKEFPGGYLVIAGANSAASLKSMPVMFLFMDELDEYPDDVDGQGPAEELAEKRTDTFARKKIFKASTPTRSGRSKIHKAYLRSDQRRYHVPCPHCHEEQVLRWEQMRWEVRRDHELRCTECGAVSLLVEPGKAEHECPHCQAKLPSNDDTVVERETDEVEWARYQCAHCDELIEEFHKDEMLRAGRWVKQNPLSRVPGFQLPSLYSPLGWFGWVDAVKLWLKAQKDATKVLLALFHNTVLAEPYADRGLQLAPDELRKRALHYKQGQVPMGAMIVVASVDVQGNRLEVLVMAYGREEESWVIAHEVIHEDPALPGAWASLDEYLGKTFIHESGQKLKILATAVDSGYLAHTVYNYCRLRAHRNVFAIKGVPQQGKAILGRKTKQDVDHHGHVIKDGVDLYPVGVDTGKTLVQKRLGIELAGPGCVHFPLGLPDEFFAQLTAERQVPKYVKGYLRVVWEKDSGARNEAFDLMVYAYAAAIKAGLTRVNWDRMEAMFKATGDLFTAPAVQQHHAESARTGEPGKPGPAVEQSPLPASLVPAATQTPPAAQMPGGFFNAIGRRVRSRGIAR